MERDPFQPLSAKDDARGFSSGGRKFDAARAKMARSGSAREMAKRICDQAARKARARKTEDRA